jgi:DNA ligase D-like protein (predicted polymerase)
MASEATILSVPGPHGDREVRISSPSRILWPEAGITKLDLANYLVTVGTEFIAANGDRPVSLQRFPGGIDGEQFFSKNPPKGAPDYVRSEMVVYPSARSHPQLVLDEPAAAVWAAQMNTVVFHPWASRAETSDFPDQLRIDLDPQPGTDFDDAKPVALELRAVLAEAGLDAFIKTSGNRGLHVFAPIRPEKEFLDVANRDRTMAGAYSPRALAHAPVSCPLDWSELDGADPMRFTILTVPERLSSTGDPWKAMHDAPGSIDVLLDWWARDSENGLGELPFPPDYPKMPGEPPRVQPSRAKKQP